MKRISTPEEHRSLGLFWSLYVSVRKDVDEDLRVKALAYPEFSRLLELTPAEEMEQVARRSRVLQERAIQDDDWEPFEADLEEQGAAYARAGIGFRRWFELVSAFRAIFGPFIVKKYSNDPDTMLAIGRGMSQYLDIAMGAIGEGYLRAKEEIIGRQKAEILELFTPVLQLEDRVLVLPLVGTVGSNRAQQITDQLLHAIREKHARAAVIDVTGVPGADQIVAQHLLNTVEASRLMGATVFVTGLSSETAQSLISIGVDISTLNTHGDLQSGVEAARRLVEKDSLPPTR